MDAVFMEDEGWEIHERVALPIRLLQEIQRERQERKLAELLAEEARETEANRRGDDAAVADSQFGSQSGEEWCDPLADHAGPKLKILDRAAIDEYMAFAGAQTRDSSSKSRQKELHKLLKSKGEYRQLATMPEDWQDRLSEMHKAFPNFAEVIGYLRVMFALATLDAAVPRLDPMVLQGPPGVGKSLFASRLSEFLGGGVRRVNMETAQTGSSLSGSEEYWGNTKPGIVFESLVEGNYANPMIFVDEVDKASTDDRHNPLAPLYMLLEPGTAASFRDLSVPRIQLDASRINWVMTSNSLSSIPRPILDRVKVFDIPAFDIDQAKQIAQRIFDSLIEELNVKEKFASPPEDVLSLLGGMSARRQRQALREAIGRALLDCRWALRGSDIRLTELDQDAARRIGFV